MCFFLFVIISGAYLISAVMTIGVLLDHITDLNLLTTFSFLIRPLYSESFMFTTFLISCTTSFIRNITRKTFIQIISVASHCFSHDCLPNYLSDIMSRSIKFFTLVFWCPVAVLWFLRKLVKVFKLPSSMICCLFIL